MIEDWLSNAYEGMSRRQFIARMAAAGVGLAGFAAASSSVDGEVITTTTSGINVSEGTVMSGDFPVPIYEAKPSAHGQYPILIVIPEIFGLHEHIRDVTRRFAKEGFLCITFEPYAREGGVLHIPDMAAVRKVVDPVPDERVMKDLDTIMAYAKRHKSGRADRIGITGFCRGGLYTLLYAARSAELKAAVAWYGQIRPQIKAGVRTAGPLEMAALIKCPILGLYGGEDVGIPVADVREMENALKKAGTTAEFIVYPGAPHAFFADYRPSYRAEAAKDAWQRCLSWLHRYLEVK
jgi:carboxymethylenebutenolidase